MASNRKVMVLPGDGIGNEVMQANMKIIDWLANIAALVLICLKDLLVVPPMMFMARRLPMKPLPIQLPVMRFFLARLAHRNMMAFRLRFVP